MAVSPCFRALLFQKAASRPACGDFGDKRVGMTSDLIELNGKTALVTGAAKRLGRAVSLALAQAGVNVVLHYHTSKPEVGQTLRALRACGVQAWSVQADLRDTASGAALVEEAAALAGPLDFLVNNASIFPESTLDEMDDAAVFENLGVNALAPFGAARAFGRQGRPGAIVNFLDSRYNDYDRKHVAYHLSKRSFFALTRMLAEELAPAIRVNAVAPGLVLPPPGKDVGHLEALHDTTLLKRHGSAEGVAEAVLFLLRSGFITGQVLFLDGGRHMKGAFYG